MFYIKAKEVKAEVVKAKGKEMQVNLDFRADTPSSFTFLHDPHNVVPSFELLVPSHGVELGI